MIGDATFFPSFATTRIPMLRWTNTTSISKIFNVSRLWEWTHLVSQSHGLGFFLLGPKVALSAKRVWNLCVSALSGFSGCWWLFVVWRLHRWALEERDRACSYSIPLVIVLSEWGRRYKLMQTLHRDAPLNVISQYGAFLNSSVVDDFNNYASIVFQRYGKKVKTWFTFNEPQVSDSLFDPYFRNLRLSMYRFIVFSIWYIS